jgi:hypothetical protein
MEYLIIILFSLIPFTFKAQDITGLYINPEINKYSEVILNLYPDSSFNYFFCKEDDYAVIVIDRSGKFILKDGFLFLLAIMTNDTLKFKDSMAVMTNKNYIYSDYFILKSDIYSSKPEICIQLDDSIKKSFPDLRVFLDYDFKNEIKFDQNNKVVFEYPKTTVLRYINLRSVYFSINIDFDSYYRDIDKNNWHVEKNLLMINMKDKLLEFKQMNFKRFAKYMINKNSLNLINAIEPDYYTMLNNTITMVLKRKD